MKSKKFDLTFSPVLDLWWSVSHVTVKVEGRTFRRSGSNSGEDQDNGSDGEKWIDLILGTVEVGNKVKKEENFVLLFK